MTPEVPGSARWSPPIALVACGWVLAVATIVWWVTAASPVDQVFIGIVVVALVAASAHGSLLRPRLHADHDGVTVRTITGAHSWPWHEVHVRVQRSQRLGRQVASLELEVPERDKPGGLVVLNTFDLGEDIVDVAEKLNRFSEQGR